MTLVDEAGVEKAPDHLRTTLDQNLRHSPATRFGEQAGQCVGNENFRRGCVPGTGLTTMTDDSPAVRSNWKPAGGWGREGSDPCRGPRAGRAGREQRVVSQHGARAHDDRGIEPHHEVRRSGVSFRR